MPLRDAGELLAMVVGVCGGVFGRGGVDRPIGRVETGDQIDRQTGAPPERVARVGLRDLAA
jgi:hypothetical protein